MLRRLLRPQSNSVLRLLLSFITLFSLLGIGLHGDFDAATALAQQGQRLLLPAIKAPSLGHLLIAAAHIDSALTGEGDEAILLWNAGSTPVELAGWTLEVNGRRTTFPSSGAPELLPGGHGWC